MAKAFDKISSLSIFAVVFLIPFYFFRFKVLGLPTNILEVMILVSALLVVIDLIIKRQPLKWMPIWGYLFVLTTLIGYYYAADKTIALGIIKGWFVLPFAFGWICINKLKKEDIPRLAWSGLLASLVISLWAILQKAGLITTLFYQKDDPSFSQYLTGNFRVFGPFESPNYLAMFLVPMAFLSLPVLESTKSKILHFFTYFCWFMIMLAVFLSGSRAGLIALAVSPIVYILLTGRVGNFQSLFLRISFIGVAFLALASGILTYGLNPGSDSIRLEIYKYSIKLVEQNPITGIGLGNFYDKIAAISVGVESFRVFALPYALHPHNIFLAIWLYQGILGIIFFAALIISFLVKIRRSLNFSLLQAGYFCGLMAILIHGLFDTTYFKNDLSVIFWLVIATGIILAPAMPRKKEQFKSWF